MFLSLVRPWNCGILKLKIKVQVRENKNAYG